MKGEARREQILRCATEAFADRGYHQTSIADIVERAGVARGTLYQYFGDKRSIFAELLDRFIQEIAARMVPIDPSVDLARGLALVRQNVRAVLELMLERRALTKILLSDAVGLDPDFDRKLLDFYEHAYDMLARSLRHGQAMGVVRACDVELASIFIVGGLRELMVRVTMGGYPPDIDAIVGEFLPHISSGLLVGAAETGRTGPA